MKTNRLLTKTSATLLVVLLSGLFWGCPGEKEKEDTTVRDTALLFALTTACVGDTVSFVLNGRSSCAVPGQAVLGDATGSTVKVAFNRVAVVNHPIGIVKVNANVGTVVTVNGIDVADFDGTGTAASPLIYKKGTFPLTDADVISAGSSGNTYTRAGSSPTWTYTLNSTGVHWLLFYIPERNAAFPDVTITRTTN